MSAVVIILPAVSIVRYDPDNGITVSDGAAVGQQRLLPSSDRRNVVVLERVRQERRRPLGELP